MVIKNFIGAKSLKKILEGLKRKFVMFIGTKTYLTLNNMHKHAGLLGFVVFFL